MRRAAALGLAVVILGASAVSAAAVAGAATAERSPLHRGRLSLTPCDIGSRETTGLPTLAAYCTAFAVPEDWQAPHGRVISLKVAIVTAEGAAEPDVVTFLDGGPGGAATQDYPQIAAALEPLRERHDILLIDQRGTGGSNALDCTPLSQVQQAPDQLGQAEGPQALTPLLRACLASLQARAAPQNYTTSEAVRDLEAVREALGAPSLDVVGISYGTRVAQQYAARYPSAVRSLVLDGPVPNSLALLSDHARNLEQALRSQFARCRQIRACAAEFGDPYATLYRLRDRLHAHPQPVQLRDPVSFEPLQMMLTADDLAAVVRFYAYSPLTAALLPLMLQAADQGNYAPLLGQKKWLTDDLGDQITSGVELSVICAEDVDLLSARPEDEDTLLGNGVIRRAQQACQTWPKGRRPTNFHTPLSSSLPVLILAGELDPVTPPSYGREILRTLPHARLLIASGQGHGVIATGCMPRLVQQFVEDLDPTALGARCLERLGATPAFIDYNGAAP